MASDYSFNVDEALDNIDLTFGGYSPSEDALDFFNVIRLVLGKEPEVGNALMHYFLVDLVFGNVKRENYPYAPHIQEKIRINSRKIAIIASRGTAKSTIITAFMPVYLAIKGTMPNFGSVSFSVGIGDSQEGGAKVMANTIRDMCEESIFCNEFFEDMRFTDQECEFLRQGKGKALDRSFMFKTKGGNSSIRGIRYKGQRPQLIFGDDIIKTEADANSETIMNNVRSMLYSDAINALDGRRGKVILVNTPFNKEDPVYSALESGSWTPVCLPICERIGPDLKREDFVGAWEQMHSYERVMERYEDAAGSNSTRAFNQELMLRISSEEDRMIQDSMIEWYSRSDIESRLGAYNIYITTDFTTTSEAKSDFSAITTWAVGPNQDYYLLDLCVKRQGIQEQYDELFRMVKYWATSRGRSVDVGIEVDGQQKAHIFALKEMMLKRSEWFTIARQKGAKQGAEGIMSRLEGGNKHWRFRMMLPMFQNKKIFFPNELRNTQDMREALNQLKYVTYAGFGAEDDFIDTVSQLGMIDIRYPVPGLADYLDTYSTNHNMSKNKGGIWSRVESGDVYSDNAYSSYA
jgi:phage terminase large subunit-like protein